MGEHFRFILKREKVREYWWLWPWFLHQSNLSLRTTFIKRWTPIQYITKLNTTFARWPIRDGFPLPEKSPLIISLNTLDLSTAQKWPDRGPFKINKWTEKEQRKWAYASDFDGPAAFSKEQERLLLFEESSGLTTHHYIIL